MLVVKVAVLVPPYRVKGGLKLNGKEADIVCTYHEENGRCKGDVVVLQEAGW